MSKFRLDEFGPGLISDRDLVNAALDYVNDKSWHGAAMHLSKDGTPSEWFDADKTVYTIGSLEQAKELVRYLMPNEMNTTSAYAGGEGPQKTPFAFQAKKKRKSDANKENKTIAATGWKGRQPKTDKWFKKMDEVLKNGLSKLDEISYKAYKTDESMSSKQKINTAINEINSKLREIERAVRHASKLKTEVGADQSVFLKSTMNKFYKINERMLRISNYIREMNK